jgi:hypothetical protein
MPKIGSFGAAIRELDPDAEPVTFDFFDVEFTVRDLIPPALLLQFGAAVAGKTSIMRANAAVYAIFRASLSTPERDGQPADTSQFDRFFHLAVTKRCDDDDLVELAWTLIGAQGDLPTVQPPTSPDGPLPTSENSNSSSPDTPDSPTFRSVEDLAAGLA